jgi:hypothetical protein
MQNDEDILMVETPGGGWCTFTKTFHSIKKQMMSKHTVKSFFISVIAELG